ncbi:MULTISPECIES: NAD(P)-dependent oxidoreductase [Bradyrhizobium]|uniref:NAD(P)-dependent oxidoreductase n=3 Tax=Bradyrhizobium TaxID=374 RepID=A0AAE5X8J2_9BRAD|nr:MULTISPECIES: NAD(P)-dependent oxidoreductase [Bradyrhizobium]QOZ49764.1 NAD(P)-dependent oxidoreductase [Bradyrhizobium sp. CCBAU 53340]QOZ56885.1 NAD(P)-dependent oxidoreductase [Bradyrhizobium sp. CCBAU 53338]QOZ80839.1 NAD(P)-dependent oxidoreductase [Bradyrhizobium sp. CCBAU 53351]MDN4985425.1 NAD(P)-dependent oxidoreductase [Bradyrhizobium sp. WYCCWR 13022]MDN5002343.1 NAD(P)-dependent oxidoreductase [Bradyrhizobium sp. WYCCWR 12677]
MIGEESSPNVAPKTAKQRIGLIGAGRMGTGIGISLLRHQIELHIKANKTRFGADRLTGAGAHEHPSIAELARHVNAVVLSLPSSREVEAVCLGQDGLFVHMPRGGLIIDCSTSYPASTVALAEQAQKCGLSFMDAPVTRSPEQAELGLLNAIVGSNEKLFPVAEGILGAFCETVLHVGDVGQGHKLKLVYNSMTMGIAAVAAEVCQFACGLDVDLVTLRSLVSRGSTNSGIFQAFVSFLLGEKPDVLAISIANSAKDIECAVRLAGESAVPVPVLAAAAHKLNVSVVAGKGELTLPHLSRP